MFDSGIKVNDLIDELKAEVDIAVEIHDETYISWLNALQQILYTEVIREQKKITLPPSNSSPLDLSGLDIENDENRPRFEDIYAVYADNVQLIKSTVTSGVIFPDTYYKDNGNLGYNAVPDKLTIVYIVKPALVTATNYHNKNVMVPSEFIDLVRAKLRGEAYKLANEDILAAKWLNDYNVLLETFKVWVAEKKPNFGL